MSGAVPGRGSGPRRGPWGTRAVRIAAAILLFLLVIILAIGALRRDPAGPPGSPSVTVKAPPPPANPAALSRPAAAGASSTGRESGAGTAGSAEGVPAGGRESGGREVSVAGPPGRESGTPQMSRTIRGAGFPPVVLEGQLRLFIAGIGSLPVVIPGTETRIVVEAAADGGPAEVVIAAAPGGTAAVSVLSGTVAVAAGGRRVRVGPGTFTTVARGAPPALPEALPLPLDHAASSDGS